MIRKFKDLIVIILRKLGRYIFYIRLTFLYKVWGIEAINRVLLNCNPFYIRYLLTRFGATVESDCDINSPLIINYPLENYTHLKIGHQCHLGKEVLLDLCDYIYIENNVTISMRTMIITHIDVGQSPLQHDVYPSQNAPVTIRHGAYIGAGATILRGVTIGEYAIIGAGSVVLNDIPSRCVAVGVPARVLKTIEID